MIPRGPVLLRGKLRLCDEDGSSRLFPRRALLCKITPCSRVTCLGDRDTRVNRHLCENLQYQIIQWFTCISNWAHYLLTPWCRVLPEQLTGLRLVKKFPAFHGSRRFITALTNVRHLSLSWASPNQSTCPHTTSWRCIIMLSTHLRLGLPSGLLPSGFSHQDPIHSPLLTRMCHMPSSSHSSRVTLVYLNAV
jgi:hypothetical protein